MDPIESEPYEFLDLSDVNDSERNEIINTLTSDQTAQLNEVAGTHRAAGVSSRTSPRLLSSDASIVHLNQNHQQQQTDVALNRNAQNENLIPVNGLTFSSSNNSTLLSDSFERTTSNLGSSLDKRSAVSSKKSSNNDANAQMSLPLPTVSNLTATAIESSLSVIDSNGNLVKVQHLQKAEKTQYGHVVRNLMLPRLIAPLSLPLYAVVKPTTAKLTELAVVPLRAPIIPASAAVKSHADQQGKARINVKSCGTSNLKLANVTMAQHTQPVVHQSPPQQQQQQQPQQPPPPQQQQQQQQQQQIPASQQSQQHQQPPTQIQQSSQQQSNQQQQQQAQQQQQIASTSASAVSQQNSSYPHHGGSGQPVYNQMHPGNIYVSAHGVQPVGGPMYPAMIPTGIPPNVYVNNVTANVNLHGWAAHSVPAYIQGGPQHYMPGDVQPALVDQSNQVMQTMQPVAVTSSNTGRSARRGRGRNNNNNNRRNDYVQRQQQESPAPQDIVNAPTVDPQAMANAGYPPYAYQYNYPTYFGAPPQNHMVHPQAQQATGPPLYVASPIPVYPGPQIYNYHPSVIYQSMMHPAEYQFDENGDDQRSNDGMIPQMWHQPMYADEYVNQELIAPEDMNHNAPSLASSETPSMLSPNYQIYDPQMQQTLELQQQMSVMHIYDEQQIQPHPGHMQQMEDEMSDCALQQMQGGTMMQPIMQPLEQQQSHHHIIQNQGISIDGSSLDQSGGSDHSLHEQHMPNNNNNDAVIDAGGIAEHNIEQQPQQIQQPVPTANYHHKTHHQHPPQQLHMQQQYAPNQVPNAVTKDNTRDSNQNVPNIAPQHHANARNQSKEHINMHNQPHYNSQTDEHPPQPQHQQQLQQQQPPPPQQQQQQQQQQHHQAQQQHLQQQQHHQHQHQQYQQHHRNAAQQQQQQQPQNASVPTNNNVTVHNNDSSAQQITAPMVNKTMSWTNSHTKKSTASVAVTATPTSTNKQYNLQIKSSSTYTSNNNHHHSTQQQPQVKNYGVMKTPSSPVANSHNNNSNNSNNNNNNNSSSSNVLTTVPPPQGNVPPSERKFSAPVAVEHKISVSTTSIASTVVPQQFQPQLVADSIKTPAAAQSVKKAEVLNLAPPITSNASNTGNSSSSQSWASLFASANTTNFTTSVASSSAPFSAKKPIAKVAPYEGITTAVPSPPVVTPGAMSYSAASAQGLPPPTVNQVGTSKQKTSADAAATTTARNSNIDEWSFQFAEILTKHKTNFSTVSLRPRGLTNPSNYCYINSILQALMGCAPFYNLIKSIPKQLAALSSEVKTPTINAMLQFTSEFSSLPSGLRLNRPQKQTAKGKDDMGSDLHCDPAFEPTAIYKLWNDSREEHVEGRQEDAEEFLGYVLNKLNDEMLEVIKLIAKPSVEQNGGEQTSESDEGAVWQMIRNNRNKGSITRQTDFGRTPLSDIFRGELRSRLQREGEHSTDVIQPFFTLQLNIEKAASVKEALEILVGRDQLEGVTGSKSKQEVVAWQQMTLEKLPVVLILHLKWFDYKSDGCTKILKTVEFPVELKIDPKILASKKYSQKQRIYRLFAVVYHDGKEASKGHYITDVYHTGYSSWLRFDDSTVKPVSEHNVLRPRVPRVPYLLYYRRCDTMPNLPQTTTTTLQTNANSNK